MFSNKYVEKCSTSLVIREIQMKTTTKYHYTPTRMTTIKNTDPIKVRQRGGAMGISHTTGGNLKQNNTLEADLVVSCKVKHLPTQKSNN